jgi:hypothetical protein
MLLASTAYAGNLIFEAEEEEEIIIAEEPMGSSNASWIVPLLAIGIIGLAIAASQDDDDDEDEEEDEEPEDEELEVLSD